MFSKAFTAQFVFADSLMFFFTFGIVLEYFFRSCVFANFFVPGLKCFMKSLVTVNKINKLSGKKKQMVAELSIGCKIPKCFLFRK